MSRRNSMYERKGTQIEKGALDGVEFAADDGSADAPPEDPRVDSMRTLSPEQSIEGNRANQLAAAEFITRMKGKPIVAPVVPVAVRELTADEVAKMQPRTFRVLKDKKISWGASDILFRAGKLVNDRNYQIRELTLRGVELEEIDANGVRLENPPPLPVTPAPAA